MGLYNNSPTFTYISATGITVTYNEEVYTVQSFYTNKKYIYWDYSNATVLQASNTMPARSLGRYLVIINDNGIATTVPSTYEKFEISYTGDTDEAIKSRVYALYEKNKELGDKYVAVEQDIDGIKQIVGSSENPESGTLIDRVSKVEQTADNISLKVEENQKTYSEDKEATKLREDLNSAIIKLNTSLGTFSVEMSNYYKDDKISNEEKVSVETMLEQITSSKGDVLFYTDKVKLIAQESGDTTGISSLNSAITSLETVHTSLINIVTTVIGDGVITPSEKTVIINAIAQYNLKINEFKNTSDDIIFLGVGGAIIEKLTKINMDSNEIRLSVSTVESNFTSELSLQKLELKGQINEVSSNLVTFKNTVETTFRDGIITEAEKKVLLEKIEQLEKEKLDVDARYLDAYNNIYLVGAHKENLNAQHNKFDSKHSQLKNKIVEVVNLGNVTESETLQINTLFNEYSIALSELKVVLDNSLDIITTNKANEEILKAKRELSSEIADINNSLEGVVDNLDYLISDGIVDASERKAIESTLVILEKERVDVEAQFTYWASNSYLVDPLRSQYNAIYELYLTKYDHVISTIDSIIYKEGLVNDTDKNNLMKAHTDLSNVLYDFLDKTNVVIEFVTLKQYEDLISVVEEDIKDINDNLRELDIVLDGTLEDNFLSESEKIVIREQLAVLEREKIEVDNNHYSVYNNPYLSSDLKKDLKSEYDFYIDSYNHLVSTIERIMNKDGLILTNDRIDYDNAIAEYKESIDIYTFTLKQSIDDISNNSIDEAKDLLQKEISDVLGSLENLESDMNSIFRDGVLSDAEKTTIKQQLETLKKEKEDVERQYASLYSNTSLVDTSTVKPKSELRIAYDNFITKYHALVSTINTIISKTTIISDTDRNNLTNALNDYRSASTFYIGKATNAIDSIAQKKADDSSDAVDKKYAEIILGENGIQSIVEHIKGDYASKSYVEQSTSSIRSTVESIQGDYVGQSQLTQTVEGFKFSFTESGGSNRLYNTAFKNGTSEWSLLSWNQCGGDQGASADLGVYPIGSEWSLANRNTLYACVLNLTNRGATQNSLGVGFDSCRIWGGVNWTFQCLLASHRAKSITIEILEFDSANNRFPSYNAYVIDNPPSGGNDRHNWHKHHCTFTLKNSGCAYFIIRTFMNEWTGDSNSAYIWIAEPIVALGHQSDIIYTSSADELYSGVTTIDQHGVKVNSYNSSVNTLMNADGFYVQQNGSNILQADGNGINLHQGQVALNQWGLWVNSPNSGTNTAIDSNGFYVNQNGHQIMKVDGGGVSLHQGQVALNQNGLWVNSPNTDTSTNIDANGFYIRQGNSYPLRADGDGVTIGQGRVLVNKWGVQVYHDDGSYSQMDGGGFFNYVNGTGNRYHHLMTMGEYECYSEETKRIWLPAEFRNKPFRVVTSVKRVKANYDLYVNKAPLLSFYAHADNISHSEGWIDVYASVRGWNYNSNMGSDRGQVIGDEPADDYILKPIVAYWVIV